MIIIVIVTIQTIVITRKELVRAHTSAKAAYPRGVVVINYGVEPKFSELPVPRNGKKFINPYRDPDMAQNQMICC